MTASAITAPIDNVLFDLGGVLIDWDPRYLYRTIFTDDEAMERFLTEVCTPRWNHAMDAGRTMAESLDDLHASFPDHSPQIAAWQERWPEMLKGPIAGTVAILEELHGRGVPLYALTNWSADTFHHATERFSFLGLFRDILVSGREKLAKPDPRIYEMVVARNGLDAARTIFIDDVPHNVEGARSTGLQAVQFISPEKLRRDLVSVGLLPAVAG